MGLIIIFNPQKNILGICICLAVYRCEVTDTYSKTRRIE